MLRPSMMRRWLKAIPIQSENNKTAKEPEAWCGGGYNNNNGKLQHLTLQQSPKHIHNHDKQSYKLSIDTTTQ